MLSLVGKIKDLCKTKNVTTKRLNISITLLRELYDQAFQLDLISANSYNKGKLLLKHDKVVKVKTEKFGRRIVEEVDCRTSLDLPKNECCEVSKVLRTLAKNNALISERFTYK